MPALAIRPSTVLRFPGGQRVRLDSPAAVTLVQQELVTNRKRFKEVALRAGISPNTVARIAYGDTKRPSFNTNRSHPSGFRVAALR